MVLITQTHNFVYYGENKINSCAWNCYELLILLEDSICKTISATGTRLLLIR